MSIRLHPNVRILFFVVISALTGFALQRIVPNDQLRILTFGVLLLLMSLIFPWIFKPLRGRSVDLIYYSAAICGAYLYFVSTELEQQLISLTAEAASLEEKEEQLKRKSEALKKTIERDKSDLISAREEISEITIFLSSPAVQAFIEEEERIASLFERTELAAFLAHLRSQQKYCKGTVPHLQEINAQINAQKFGRQSRAKLNEPEMRDRTIFDNEQAIYDSNEREILRCVQIDYSLSNIDALDSSFQKVQAIRHYRNNPALSKFFIQETRQTGTLEVLGQERPVSDVLGEIETIQESKTKLVTQKALEKTLLSTIERSESEREETVEELSEVEEDIGLKKEKIKTKKNETMRGWTLKVSAWLAFTWPYFLISLLGLKIARVRYFERGANDE